MLTASPERFFDERGRLLGPHKECRVSVPLSQVPLDLADQRADGIERAAAHRIARQDTEPGLHQVEPRGARGREGEAHPRMRGEPGLDGRGCMGGGVVEDYVHRLAAVVARHALEKGQEIAPGVARATLPYHLPA